MKNVSRITHVLAALLGAVVLYLALPGSAMAFGWHNTIQIAELPSEAQDVVLRIKSGGPFSYSKDGIVFGNYEHRLPERPRGYYHEYTVRTPGARNRGARRIIAGSPRSRARFAASGDELEFWYTDDHYRTFRRVIDP